MSSDGRAAAATAYSFGSGTLGMRILRITEQMCYVAWTPHYQKNKEVE